MIIRSKAPLRLGLAGGGTDVSPYSDLYGGAILNATINLFAYASIVPRSDGKIIIHSIDKGEKLELNSCEILHLDGNLDLLKGIYNRIVKDFTKQKLSFELTTIVDAPPGSGLGSSSTLVTAVVGAFTEWLKIPLGEYDIAQLAYQIERIDLGYAGGKQDQYAATFGGVNFMEFYDNSKVIVNPLRIRSEVLNELAYNMVLYYTGTSRLSSEIIEKQQKSISQKNNSSVNAMHKTKEIAIRIKEAILKGELNLVGEIMHEGWQYKKQLAEGISNEHIDTIYEAVRKAGALGGKISGAGGGGFMFFYCPENSRFSVIKTLKEFGGEITPFQFTKNGLSSWTI
ncbi:MAG: GHMP kinase [Prolixibacteraceae bacterium]|nr:GHMP kinase [Prolixibacteraceae bacterium]